jgi:hypothetical protein
MKQIIKQSASTENKYVYYVITVLNFLIKCLQYFTYLSI